MKQKFLKSWKKSIQPRKQRKYRANAPLHIRDSFLSVHLSKELRTKYGTRSIRVRTGDKVKVLRGQHAKTEGKVEDVNTKTSRVYVSKIESQKKDGSKAKYPLQPSNLLIIELNTDDKKRLSKLKKQEKKE